MFSLNSYVPGKLLRALGTGADGTIDRQYQLDGLGGVQAITGGAQSGAELPRRRLGQP